MFVIFLGGDFYTLTKQVIARKVLEALTEWFEVLTKACPPRSRNNGADLSNPEI